MTTYGHDDGVEALAHAMRHAPNGTVVLTGAGVSVASGVPSFRGSGGLWCRYDPDVYATIDALRADPQRVWGFLRELDAVLSGARPNPAHHAIAELERRGFVTTVVTQNIDALHQSAGSRRVIELHGTFRSLTCLACGAGYDRADVVGIGPDELPTCAACGGLLKPDVTLFGEELPLATYRQAEHAARTTSLLLVIGTSAEVVPAARLPILARLSGAAIWEVNPEPALEEPDGTVRAPAEVALPALAAQLGRGSGSWRALLRALRALRGLDVRRWLD